MVSIVPGNSFAERMFIYTLRIFSKKCSSKEESFMKRVNNYFIPNNSNSVSFKGIQIEILFVHWIG